MRASPSLLKSFILLIKVRTLSKLMKNIVDTENALFIVA